MSDLCGEMRIDRRPGGGTDTWVCNQPSGHDGPHAVVVTRRIHAWMDEVREESPLSPAEQIAANKWDEPFEIGMTGDATPADVAKAIILDRRPGTKFRYTPNTGHKWSDLFFRFGVDKYDNDPFRDAEEMALGAGMRLFFDGDVCVIENLPAPEADRGMWEFDEDAS